MLAATLAVLATPTSANAQAAAVVAAVQSLGQTIISTVMNSFSTGVLVPLTMKATGQIQGEISKSTTCLLYTSPSPRDS